LALTIDGNWYLFTKMHDNNDFKLNAKFQLIYSILSIIAINEY
jgi:hypothetical protein